MHTLSYTISPVLQQTLREVERSREKILLKPLAPSVELNLRWNAAVQRIYYSLHLAHNPVTHKQIMRVLMASGRSNLTPEEKEIIKYKHGYDYIHYTWLMNPRPVMPQTVHYLSRFVIEEKSKISDAEIMEMLVFLQTSKEHPLIQTFIAYVQFAMASKASDTKGTMARLLSYLFLFKAGLDYRGLLVLEEYYYRNERLLRELLAAVERRESISVWIEHFVQSIASHLEDILKRLDTPAIDEVSQKIAQVTERQQQILAGFDQPGMRITNKKVQQMFKISQITASRDLAKLSSLGLLFQYGKGRSVYYTRA